MMSAVKVYTKTGDEGRTSLLSGGRVGKDHARIEAYGTLDELNSVLGLLRTEPLPAGVEPRLMQVQETLFSLGSVLSDPEGRMEHPPGSWSTGPLEAWIDAMDAELEPLRAFILPGGCRAAGLCHLARTVCRRAERRTLVVAQEEGGTPEGVLPYLNRLSDLLFVLARFANARLGIDDPQWRGGGVADGV